MDQVLGVPRLALVMVLGVPRLALVIPAYGKAELSARGTVEGFLGSAHQKGGHLSCLTTELRTKAAPFSRVTEGFKMRGMVPHGFNYARARSAGRPYRVSRAPACTPRSALEAELAEPAGSKATLQKLSQTFSSQGLMEER